MARSPTAHFLNAKLASLLARSERLSTLTPDRLGLRPQDIAYAPSEGHFVAANRRLARVSHEIQQRRQVLERSWTTSSHQQRLIGMAMLEREVDRLRRTFGMLFEIFMQRGTAFAPALAAHDTIAVDCYAAIRRVAPEVMHRPLLKPVTYMEHGYSPATQRRGIQLARLLGDSNPFPVIRIPWDRDNPWQSVFLHEVSHNLQADLRLWQENQTAIASRLSGIAPNPIVAAAYRRWHKEIFADLAALLLGGPASAAGMMTFLANPQPRALTYRPGGAHPTGYVRGFIMSAMLDRMGFSREAAQGRQVWRNLYDPSRGNRMPPGLLASIDRVVPAVVDEIAYQPRMAIGQRALADVIPFTVQDQAAIRRGAMQLSAGHVPTDLPPRFLVSASGLALAAGAPARALSHRVISHLASIAAAGRARPTIPQHRAA